VYMSQTLVHILRSDSTVKDLDSDHKDSDLDANLVDSTASLQTAETMFVLEYSTPTISSFNSTHSSFGVCEIIATL